MQSGVLINDAWLSFGWDVDLLGWGWLGGPSNSLEDNDEEVAFEVVHLLHSLGR
jgi:hypothetical protein